MNQTADRRLLIKIKGTDAQLKEIASILEGLLDGSSTHETITGFNLKGKGLMISLILPENRIDPFLHGLSDRLKEISRQTLPLSNDLLIEVSDENAFECPKDTSQILEEDGWKIHIVPDDLQPDTNAVPPSPDTIVVKTGWAFGSGRHPSTKGAISALCHLHGLGSIRHKRVLDVGTGTGLLALLAGKMEADEVIGIDIDKEWIHIARQNVAINGLSGKVRILYGIHPLNLKKQDVIVANLTPSVLSGLIETLVDTLDSNGYLVLSGYRSGARPGLEQMLQKHGMETFFALEKEGWTTEIFRFIRS